MLFYWPAVGHITRKIIHIYHYHRTTKRPTSQMSRKYYQSWKVREVSCLDWVITIVTTFFSNCAVKKISICVSGATKQACHLFTTVSMFLLLLLLIVKHFVTLFRRCYITKVSLYNDLVILRFLFGTAPCSQKKKKKLLKGLGCS